MANNVFANGREISCKAGSGKSIAAFPDVCMTPPENPATPPGVPVPYPNTGMASDTTSGSSTVKITGKEVMLKNKSYFKKSIGDEAGCAAKKGVVTSVNRGKVYFVAWSMDVKVEGENVVRHLDMTTHNHGSAPNSPPMVHQDRMSLIKSIKGCRKEKKAIKENCGDPLDERAECPDPGPAMSARQKHRDLCASHPVSGDAAAGLSSTRLKYNTTRRANAQAKADQELRNYASEVRKNKCQQALRCALVPYDKARNGGCCPPQTPEHLVPAAMFGKSRGTEPGRFQTRKQRPVSEIYSAEGAACMCAEGGAQRATHGLLGRGRREFLDEKGYDCSTNTADRISVREAAECGATSANRVMPQCGKACIQKQLEKNHEDMGCHLDSDKVAPVQSDDGKSIDPGWESDFNDLG